MAKASELIVKPATWHSQAFTASGTFNVPNGVELIYVSGCGGGGGGAGSTSQNSVPSGGVGGAGAGGADHIPLVVSPNTQIAVTVGSAGVGGANGTGAEAGTSGGNSQVGSIVINGGSGASASTSYFPPGGFQTDHTLAGSIAPFGYILGAGQGQRCGIYVPNHTPVSTGGTYNNSGLSGGAGPYGNGARGGAVGGTIDGFSGAPNTGAGGGGGGSPYSNANYPNGGNGGNGGSGYIFIEWMA